MALFAIADLHLAQAVDKPMDVFGPEWDGHPEKIREAWCQMVSDTDIVLLPGDISWAMTMDEALPDLRWIGALPGIKVMIRGNHDYWWSGIGKVRRVLGPNHYAIQNDALALGDWAICGTRGWLLPSHPKFTETDETIYRREANRLKLSLDAAKQLGRPIVAMLHYPPCGELGETTVFTELLVEYGVQLCVYGHLHGPAHRFAVEGLADGVEYRLVSADYVGFKPVPLLT
ncbi:metallophosphoesterase [Alicyclobacillus sp.]|uniref:metallophosphoesterase n=1 Tax=Alicyclobacillus sp. TaxID=61169 RepID=UPI0025BBEB46|nr:metallophosphoesterase [Alicyclobacillus sp.]MCL6518115.1 metallophosphoesterase [Alicyclobacillus sp.]